MNHHQNSWVKEQVVKQEGEVENKLAISLGGQLAEVNEKVPAIYQIA